MANPSGSHPIPPLMSLANAVLSLSQDTLEDIALPPTCENLYLKVLTIGFLCFSLAKPYILTYFAMHKDLPFFCIRNVHKLLSHLFRSI